MSIQSKASNQGYTAVGSTAAAGAAIGTMIVPGIGTAIGGAIGSLVGGIASAFHSSNKAEKYQKKAESVQRQREANVQADKYLQMIREARITRATSLASGTYAGMTTGSVLSDALSSIGSQSMYTVQFSANDERLVELYNRYMKKAGAYANAASNTMSAAKLTASAIGTIYMAAGSLAGAAAAKPVGDFSTMTVGEVANRAAMGGSSLGSDGALFGVPGTFA